MNKLCGLTHITKISSNMFSYRNDKTYRTRLLSKITAAAEIPKGHSAMNTITEIIVHVVSFKL